MSYCKLYIDTELSKVEIERIIHNEVSSTVKELKKSKIQESLDAIQSYEDLEKLENMPPIFINADIYNNENQDKQFGVGQKLDPTESKYYVEINDCNYDCEKDSEDFQRVIVTLISRLRLKLEYVVASCEFEDRIAKETGWNWTEEKPFP